MTAPTTDRPYYASPGPLGGRVRWGPPTLAAEAVRRADRVELDGALAEVPATEVPCRAGELPAEWWVAEDQELQEAAADACALCPVLQACRGYALSHAAEAGTYGGLTDQDRLSPTRVAKLRRAHNEETHV